MTDERRIHTRLETEARCVLVTEKAKAEGQVQDLSYAGAVVFAKAGVAEVGDSLSMEVALPGVGEISILGEVVRIEERGYQRRYGLRFVLVEPRQADDLRDFVDKLLMRRGQGTRKHPRVKRRIPVSCRTAEDFEALMENLSSGGMELRCDVPVVIDEEVQIEIDAGGTTHPLDLAGQVVHVRSVGVGRYQVGVEFFDLTPFRQQSLEDFIRHLIDATKITTK